MAVETVKLNIEELKDFLKHIVSNNRYLQKQGKVPVAVNIEGDSGLGKTSAVAQLAKELSLNMVRINLAEIEEIGDLTGFPVRQFQLCKPGSSALKVIEAPKTQKVFRLVEEAKTVKKNVLEGGVMVAKDVTIMVKVNKEVEEPVEVVAIENPSDCMWIDEQAIGEYTKQGYSFTGEKRMSYCPPEWIAGLTGGGILILDDYTRADIRFLQACMSLLETQKYISWSLPEDWTILLTTNQDDGTYLVTSMDTAQKTRFITVNLKFDVDVWAKWAEKTGIDTRAINFLLLHPELVTRDINPRAITTFFNCISSITDFGSQLGLIKMIGDGSVGTEFSAMFAMFINNHLDKLMSPKEMLTNPNDLHVVKELKASMIDGTGFRADIASTLANRLINYSLHFAENNTIDQKIIDRLILLSTEQDLFTTDLKYVIAKKIVNGNKVRFQKMMTNKDVIVMVSK